MNNILYNSSSCDETTPKLLTTRELAKMLGISQHKLAVDRRYNRGTPFYRIGRQVRYKIDDVQEMLARSIVLPANTSSDRADTQLNLFAGE
jgi:excisionase family DNA binding protein